MNGCQGSRAIVLAVLLSGAGISGIFAADPGAGTDSLADFDSYPPAIKGERCVAPVEIMRRRHMELLDLQKDRAIVRGLRSQRFSLQQCVECHAGVAEESGDDEAGAVAFQRIDAPGQFCAGCHQYVGVKIDCFSCHAASPGTDGGGPGIGEDGDRRLSVHSFGIGPRLPNHHSRGLSGGR